MDLVVLLGRNLRSHRQARGMSQEQLALEAGMKRSYVSELERGLRNPTVRALERLAQALETVARAWFPQGHQAVDLIGTLRDLTMPIQVIWGRGDRIIPAAHADTGASSLQVHMLDGVGHLPHMERTGEVNRLLRAALA